MEMNPLKLLVVGIGSIGKRHTEVLYNALNMRNLTLYDPNHAMAERFASNYQGVKLVHSYEEALLQGPDAVFILTPTALHIRYALMALNAGCHVMLEKPLDVSMEHVEELKALAKEKDRIVSVAFCLRHHAGIKRIAQIAKSGALGKLMSIRSEMCEYFPDSRPDYKSTYYVEYSGALELIHAVDVALWLAGGEPRSIQGICTNRSGLGFASPDHVEAVFDTDNEVVCNVTMSFCRSPGGNRLALYGTQGSLEATYTHTGYEIRTYTRAEKNWAIEQSDALYRNMQFESEDREFLQDIVEGIQRGCSISDACRSLKVFCELNGQGQKD